MLVITTQYLENYAALDETPDWRFKGFVEYKLSWFHGNRQQAAELLAKILPEFTYTGKTCKEFVSGYYVSDAALTDYEQDQLDSMGNITERAHEISELEIQEMLAQ